MQLRSSNELSQRLLIGSAPVVLDAGLVASVSGQAGEAPCKPAARGTRNAVPFRPYVWHGQGNAVIRDELDRQWKASQG